MIGRRSSTSPTSSSCLYFRFPHRSDRIHKADIYTARGLSYVKVLSAVPRELKHLIMTSFWAHLLIFITNFTLYFIFLAYFRAVIDMVDARSRHGDCSGGQLWHRCVAHQGQALVGVLCVPHLHRFHGFGADGVQ